MSGSGRESLPDIQMWSVGPPVSPGVVGRPSQISGSGRETLPDVRGDQVQEWWEALSNVRELLGGPPKGLGGLPGCPGVVGRPFQMFGSGRLALPYVLEWWETLSDVQ